MLPMLTLISTLIVLSVAVPKDRHCWGGGFSPETCCDPIGRGNPACWTGGDFTYENCCSCWQHPTYHPLRCCSPDITIEGDPRCWFDGRSHRRCCAEETSELRQYRQSMKIAGWRWEGDFAYTGDLRSKL